MVRPFWRRKKQVINASWNITPARPDPGPLGDTPAQLRRRILEYRNLADTLVFENAHVAGLSVQGGNMIAGRWLNYRADLGLEPKTDHMLMSIQAAGGLHRYILYPQGDIANQDGSVEWSLNDSPLEAELIPLALNALGKEMDERIHQSELARQSRNAKLKIAASAAVVVLVVGGGAFGVKTFIDNHNAQVLARANAIRADYDAHRPELPGEGIAVTSMKMGVVTDTDFGFIPTSAGDSDPLTSPRVIILQKSEYKDAIACATLPQLKPGQQIRLAARESSPLVPTVQSVGFTEAGFLQVCARGSSIGDNTAMKFEVAVQVK